MRIITPKSTILMVVVLQMLANSGRCNFTPSGAKAAAMSHAVTACYHPWAIAHNAAGLAGISKTTISIDYENRFMVGELSMYSLCATLPSRLGNFSALFSTFGPSLWRAQQGKLSYSRFFGNSVSCGLSFNFYLQRMPETGQNLTTIGFDMGSIVKVSTNTQLGVSVSNPVSTGSATYPIPFRIRAGGATQLSEPLVLGYELEKQEKEKLLLKSGIDWEAIKKFHFRFGFDTRPRISAGIGFQHRLFTLDIAFNYHVYLGYSPTVSFQFNLP